MSSLVSVFTLFYFIMENMSTNVRQFRFPCYIWHLWRDVVYNLFISLLPPILLDNLFGLLNIHDSYSTVFLDPFVQYEKYEQYYYYYWKRIKFSKHTILVKPLKKKLWWNISEKMTNQSFLHKVFCDISLEVKFYHTFNYYF